MIEPIRVRWLLTRWAWRRLAHDTIPMKLAWLLPKRVAYWAYIRVFAHATSGPGAIDTDKTLKVYDLVAKRWDVA